MLCIFLLAASLQDQDSPFATDPAEMSADERREEQERMLASLSPLPPLPPSPGNRHADDAGAARLGQRLFFDARLSSNGKLSCASCHDPAHTWSDGKTVAEGIGSTRRNTPSLLFSGYNRWAFWDGRADSLWSQALHPLEDPLEMGSSRLELAHRFQTEADLRQAYEAVFGPVPDFSDLARFPPSGRPRIGVPSSFSELTAPMTPPSDDPAYPPWLRMKAEDQEAVNRLYSNLGKAFEAYERRLVPGPAPFDRYVEGVREQDADKQAALDEPAQRGLALFLGRGNCTLCHFGPLFTDGEFHNTGLARLPGQEVDNGRSDGILLLKADPFNGRGAFSDARDWEANVKLRYLFIDAHVDGSYKTPTLRNVALTAPYFHDGRAATLDAVLRYYSELPGSPPIGHREESMRRAHFSDAERADLAAFLQSLTSPPLPDELTRPPAE